MTATGTARIRFVDFQTVYGRRHGVEIDAGEIAKRTWFPINDASYSSDGPTIFFETGGAARRGCAPFLRVGA